MELSGPGGVYAPGPVRSIPFSLRLRMSTQLGYRYPKWNTAAKVTSTYPGWLRGEKQSFPSCAGIGVIFASSVPRSVEQPLEQP